MNFFSPITILVTFFWVGKIPLIRGTLGSLAGLALISLIFNLPKDLGFNPNWLFLIYPISLYLLYAVGVSYSDIYAFRVRKKDPQEVVIDEVVGMMFAIYLFALFYATLVFFDKEYFETLMVLLQWYVILLFILFRIFDIFKPWRVAKAEEIRHKGRSIMLDDIWAGFYATMFAIFIFIIFYILGIWESILIHYYPNYSAKLVGV